MKIKLGTQAAAEILDHMTDFTARSFDYLMESPLGVEFTLKAIHPKQTDDQRGLYWATMADWAESEWAKENGMSKGALHELCLAKAFGFELVEIFGLPFVQPKERSQGQDILPYSVLIHTQQELIIESGASI